MYMLHAHVYTSLCLYIENITNHILDFVKGCGEIIKCSHNGAMPPKCGNFRLPFIFNSSELPAVKLPKRPASFGGQTGTKF